MFVPVLFPLCVPKRVAVFVPMFVQVFVQVFVDEERKAFIEDYRTTACINVVKWFVNTIAEQEHKQTNKQTNTHKHTQIVIYKYKRL